MKISHAWLEDFVGLDPTKWAPERVAEVLTDLGLEVEHIHNPETAYARFVVGYVQACEPHPKADKLSVCTVEVGEDQPRTIVCGASNVRAGQYVVVALDGAVIPGAGITIGKRMLRGVESNGMICSATELALGEDGEGILVLAVGDEESDGITNVPGTIVPGTPGSVPGTMVPGTPLTTALGLSTIYDVAITPNRADCLSHLGIARELHAYMRVHHDGEQVHFSNAEYTLPTAITTQTPSIPITVEAPALAPLYAVARISGVTVGPSPEWMQQRLRDVGLRPRNVIVDVTNYVNMELGQPLHAFDVAKLRDQRIVVREAGNTQEFVTLDGKTRSLQPDMLMICDGEGPVAIAGVMGGENSEIDDATTDVCLEGAWFEPRSVRRTARLLGLNTDASYRFERGVDPGGVIRALQRATHLIAELAGGLPVELNVVDNWRTSMAPISMRYERMRSVNGISVDDATIRSMLEAIGCTVTELSDDTCAVLPPSWRVDIAAEIDLAEEVMRLYGVNKVPESQTAVAHLSGERLPEHVRAAGGYDGMRLRHDVRTILRSRGYADVVTSVLGAGVRYETKELDAIEDVATGREHLTPEALKNGSAQQVMINDQVTLRNALGIEYSVLRSSLLPGLLKTIAHNINHGATTIRIAEQGNVFRRAHTSELDVQQNEHLALAACGNDDEHWSHADRMLDLYDLMSDVEAVAGERLIRKRVSAESTGPWSVNSVNLFIGETKVGTAGIVDSSFAASYGVAQNVVAAELDLRLIQSTQARTNRYHAVSPFPTMRRDVAFVVDEHVSAAELLQIVGQSAGPAYLGASVFDVFRDEHQFGPGRKSVGIALRFGAMDRTLVDADVEHSVHAIVAAASQHLGARVRGADT